jgi:DsbC/DsbD-like thiol-disulfide interchange protein
MQYRFCVAIILAGVTIISQAKAEEYASPLLRAASSGVRLVSAGAFQNERYLTGVEIQLDPRTITYWRQPGESGAPPNFNFSKSTNVAKVEIFFPYPKHITEADVVVAGYEGNVIFPVRILPKDPKIPITLNLSLEYAACSNICLPAKAELSLLLPQTGSSPFQSLLTEAWRQLPKKLDPSQSRKILHVERENKGTGWRIIYLGRGKLVDVFAEANSPIYIETKMSNGTARLNLAAVGITPTSANVTLTIVTSEGAYEAPVELK